MKQPAKALLLELKHLFYEKTKSKKISIEPTYYCRAFGCKSGNNKWRWGSGYLFSSHKMWNILQDYLRDKYPSRSILNYLLFKVNKGSGY